MEDEETEDESPGSGESTRKLSFQRQCYACSYVFLTPITFGLISLNKSNFSRIFQSLLRREISILIFVLAEFAGTLLAGVSFHFIGRKSNVILANILNSVAPVFLGVGYEDTIGFIAVVIGLMAVFFSYISFQIHTAEVADATFRAFFIGFINAGIGAGYLIGGVISGWKKSVAAFYLIVVTSSLVVSFHIPETPFYLALNGRPDEAEAIFTWLRAGMSDVDELNIILANAEIAAQRTSIATNIFSRRLGIPLLILVFAMLTFASPHCYHLAAVEVFIVPQFTDGFDWSGNDIFILKFTKFEFFSLFPPLVGGLIFLGANFIIPRRHLFLGSFMLSFLLFVVYPSYDDPLGTTLIKYSTLVSLALTNMGTTPVLDTLSVEIFPADLRHMGPVIYKFLIVMNELFIYYLRRADTLNTGYVYLVTLSLSLPVGLVFTFLFMPETKDLILSEAEKAASKLEIQVFRKTNTEENEEI